MKLKQKYTRALVTGGAGFIGSHLVEELLEEGLEVVSVDNYFAGKKENLAPFVGRPGFFEMDCDITDYNALRKCFAGVDIVFHNAASKKTICLKDPRRDLGINAEGTFNVLQLSQEFGVKKVIHASTGSVYGEARYYPQDEGHPLNPASYYGVSKLAGEKYAQLFFLLFGMDVTVLRYFHVYGPRQESSDVGGVVSIFARRVLNGESPVIFGDGNQQRSFTYVKDLVEINKLVALRAETKGQTYNCASGITVTIMELADKIKRLLGRSDLETLYGDWTPGDIKVFNVDNSKIKGLGFEFATSFDEGLDKTLQWAADYFQKRD